METARNSVSLCKTLKSLAITPQSIPFLIKGRVCDTTTLQVLIPLSCSANNTDVPKYSFFSPLNLNYSIAEQGDPTSPMAGRAGGGVQQGPAPQALMVASRNNIVETVN